LLYAERGFFLCASRSYHCRLSFAGPLWYICARPYRQSPHRLLHALL